MNLGFAVVQYGAVKTWKIYAVPICHVVEVIRLVLAVFVCRLFCMFFGLCMRSSGVSVLELQFLDPSVCRGKRRGGQGLEGWLYF